MRIILNNVRLAFPVLFEPKTVNGEGEPAYSASFIMPKDHPAVAAIREGCAKLGAEKWGAKWPAIRKEIEGKDRMPIHDGETKANYAGFPGNLFVAARNKTRPLVIDRDKGLLRAQDGRPYAGCFVNGVVELWAQDNAYGKRINASLAGVQFVRDGEAFSGGRPASVDDFGDLSDQGADEEALV